MDPRTLPWKGFRAPRGHPAGPPLPLVGERVVRSGATQHPCQDFTARGTTFSLVLDE